MSRLNDKSKLLEVLAEKPIVSFACKRVGLDRRTFYRWYKDDKQFREQVDDILTIGRMHVNDMSESVIIKKISENDLRATIFWLQHNHPQYRPVRTTYVDPISHRHTLAPGETCRTCGYQEPNVEKHDGHIDEKMTNEELSKELFKRVKSINTRKQSETELKKIIDDFVEKNNVKIKVQFVDASDPNIPEDPEMIRYDEFGNLIDEPKLNSDSAETQT